MNRARDGRAGSDPYTLDPRYSRTCERQLRGKGGHSAFALGTALPAPKRSLGDDVGEFPTARKQSLLDVAGAKHGVAG
jgi:hypothetical protein